jgi:site-specific DNA recombinase
MSSRSLDKIPIEAPVLTKRALPYLRVSSEGQVNTDYSLDGLSIEAQRGGAADKARQLGAEIVDEFCDPGKSAFVDLHKRTDFLRLLEELKRLNSDPATFIHYVIVWSLSRWARNAEDHFRTRELVRQTGARLVSITEPMIGEDTPESFYMEGMLAVNNQYDSMKTSRNVRSSLHQKAKNGGTYGWTRLGYLNDVDRLPDGRAIPTVITDPKRCAFMTHAFKLYASGEYSTAQLTDELYRLGLRSRPRKNHPAQKVTTASVHRILRDPYYAGWIVYKRGKSDEEIFKGRHEALIDQETFDKVQVLLDEKRVAGERPRKRQHYLRGSIFCAGCGSRLTYGVSTGENGRKYAYYFCASRVNRTACTERRANLRPELVEAALERMYAEHPIEMTPERVARSKAAIRGMVEVSQESLAHVRDIKTELIVKLKAQQTRLLRLYAEEGEDASPDAFRSERARMQAEITEAEKSLAETETRLRINEADLYRALELAEGVAAFYQETDDQTRRSYNQAFFKHIWIKARWNDEEGRTLVEVAGVELTDPYAVLLAEETTVEALAWVEAIKAAKKPQKAGKRLQKPHLQLPKALSGDDISIYEVLAEGERFELSVRR